MPHLRVRAPRAGYALILLTAFVGSASGASPSGSAVPVDPLASTRPARAYTPANATVLVAAVIPCATGTCAVQIPAPPDTSTKLGPTRTAPESPPLARR